MHGCFRENNFLNQNTNFTRIEDTLANEIDILDLVENAFYTEYSGREYTDLEYEEKDNINP